MKSFIKSNTFYFLTGTAVRDSPNDGEDVTDSKETGELRDEKSPSTKKAALRKFLKEGTGIFLIKSNTIRHNTDFRSAPDGIKVKFHRI